MSETPIGLQARPPLLIAIGGLEAMVQSQLQIALRVVTTKMIVPCTTVLERNGDIVLAESPVANHIRMTCAQGYRDLERPVRMVPLADSLAELIDAIVAADTPGGVPAQAASQPQAATSDAGVTTASTAGAAPSAAGSAALDTLVSRSEAGPLRLTLADGTRMFVDSSYHSIWVDRAPSPALGATLLAPAQDKVRATQDEMDSAQRNKEGTYTQFAVEQACWLGTATPGLAPALARWMAEPHAFVRLETWPNLSLQGDYLPWLNVLAALRQRPRTVADVEALGQREGIDAARLRYGLGLLFTFGHATLERAAPVAPPAAALAAAPSAAVAEAASSGVFSRLRSRLRNIMG